MARSTPDLPDPAPQALRVEIMPLECGDTAVIVEFESEPPASWRALLTKKLADVEGLELASAQFEGRVLYVLGAEGGRGGSVHRVSQLLRYLPGHPGHSNLLDQPVGRGVQGSEQAVATHA